MIVDSSVWVAYFNGQDTRHVRRLDEAILQHQPLGLIDVILTEVLQGFRDDQDFERARHVLGRLPRLALGLDTYIAAAGLFRKLRAKGITVRGTIDCIIAQACIDHDVELLAADVDFARIARHSALRLAAA